MKILAEVKIFKMETLVSHTVVLIELKIHEIFMLGEKKA